jgi:hypothetical protein
MWYPADIMEIEENKHNVKDFWKTECSLTPMGILETKCSHKFLYSVSEPANALELSGCPVFYVHRTDLWAVGFNDKSFPLGAAPWHGQSFMPLLDTLKNVDIPVY